MEITKNQEINNIDIIVKEIENLYDKKSENLKKRMSGEISGSELDKLDKEIEKELDSKSKIFLELLEKKEGSKIVDTENLNKKEERMDFYPKPKASTENEENKKLYESSKTSPERVNTVKIDSSFDLRQLTRNLNEIGDITAPDGYVYKKDYLIDIIVNLKGSEDENLKKVTNIYGLRDTVKKLLLRKELGI